jgi:hypothetical protein
VNGGDTLYLLQFDSADGEKTEQLDPENAILQRIPEDSFPNQPADCESANTSDDHSVGIFHYSQPHCDPVSGFV